MNAAQIESNCVNANIAIARSWLTRSKCCSSSVECIPHVVVRTFLTNVEALEYRGLGPVALLFKNSSG